MVLEEHAYELKDPIAASSAPLEHKDRAILSNVDDAITHGTHLKKWWEQLKAD